MAWLAIYVDLSRLVASVAAAMVFVNAMAVSPAPWFTSAGWGAMVASGAGWSRRDPCPAHPHLYCLLAVGVSLAVLGRRDVTA
ncbi:hypothetical protein [Micromonospora sp. NPDC047134]|uniref:hypothetical protein n=1 Tax=Micromonospora sp. NPDC047134 TaxID=3154340 RepID=UPI0033F8765F